VKKTRPRTKDEADPEIEALLLKRLQNGRTIPLSGAFIKKFKQQIAQRRNWRRIASGRKKTS
jgi:hypothetical protein